MLVLESRRCRRSLQSKEVSLFELRSLRERNVSTLLSIRLRNQIHQLRVNLIQFSRGDRNILKDALNRLIIIITIIIIIIITIISLVIIITIIIIIEITARNSQMFQHLVLREGSVLDDFQTRLSDRPVASKSSFQNSLRTTTKMLKWCLQNRSQNQLIDNDLFTMWKVVNVRIDLCKIVHAESFHRATHRCNDISRRLLPTFWTQGYFHVGFRTDRINQSSYRTRTYKLFRLTNCARSSAPSSIKSGWSSMFLCNSKK